MEKEQIITPQTSKWDNVGDYAIFWFITLMMPLAGLFVVFMFEYIEKRHNGDIAKWQGLKNVSIIINVIYTVCMLIVMVLDQFALI